MMKRYALSLVLVLVCVSNLFAQNGVMKTYDVRTYGAKGDGTTNDTAAIARAIAAAVAYEAATDETVMVIFPKGTYIVQDATTADTLDNENFGGIIIPSTTENIILFGYDATVKIGSNGISTAAIRCFADNCRIEGFNIDPNGDNAPALVSPQVNPNDFHTKDNSGIELNGCENSIIKSCYIINGDKSISTYSTGTITYDHDGADNLSSSAAEKLDDNTITLSGGTWPAWVDTDAAITISGTRYQVSSVVSSTVLTLDENTTTKTDNNPGSDLGSTAYSVTCYATTSGGENHFFCVNGVRCRIENCISFDATWSPFLASGDNNSITNCTAYNFKGNGIRITQGDSIYVSGFKAYSLRNDGRSAILVDAGSDAGELRTDEVFIDNCELYCNPDGDFDGACSVLKIAATYQAHVRNCKITAGSATNNVAVRLEDSLQHVFLEDSYIRPVIFFTPASTTGSVYQGVISGHANSGGFVQYSVTGAGGVDDGKRLFVRGSDIDQYNGPQNISSAGGGLIVTDRPYVAGTIGNAYCQSGVETFRMRNCIVEGSQPTALTPDGTLTAAVAGSLTFYNYMIDGCIAYDVDIEGCTFQPNSRLNTAHGCILTDYDSERAYSRFRFVHNKVTFNSSSTCRVHRGTAASTELSTSNKVIFYGNEKHNMHTGSVLWCDATNAEREILFNSAGERINAFNWTTYPVAAHVTWVAGDVIWNSAPAAGEPWGWFCTVAGSPGTWQAIESRVPLTLASNTTEVGNVGSGEDNLITYTVPASTLSRDGDCLEVEAAFTFAANGNNKTVKLYIGSDVVYNSGAVAQNGGSMVVRASLTRDTGVIAKVTAVTVPSASSSYSTVATYFQTATAFASTNVVKGTGTATSDNDVVQEYQRVRLIPAPPPP